MTIRNIRHGGVRRLFLHDDPKAVPPAAADKLHANAESAAPWGVRQDGGKPLGLTVAGAATVLGVSRPTLSAFLNGRSGVEKAFGVQMDTLVRMQASFDIALIRRREEAIRVAPYRAHP